MTLITLRRLASLAPAAAALSVVIGTAQPASAAQCNQDLAACYQQAAGIDGFWARAGAGLDCEASYAWCVMGSQEF